MTAWRDDPEIVQRVGVVATLYFQPGATALVAVNQWCRERGLPEIGYETIRTDRTRARELALEDVKTGARERMFELAQQRAAVWRDIAAAPPGPGRAPLYAESRQLTMDIARMEGSIPPMGVDLGLAGPSVRMDELPTPEELLEAGSLSQGDYQGYLRGVALMVNGGGGMAALPPSEVVEGEVLSQADSKRVSNSERTEAPLTGPHAARTFSSSRGSPGRPSRAQSHGVRVYVPTR